MPPCAQAAPPTHPAVHKAAKHPPLDRRIFLMRQHRRPHVRAAFPADRQPGMIPEINGSNKPATKGKP